MLRGVAPKQAGVDHEIREWWKRAAARTDDARRDAKDAFARVVFLPQEVDKLKREDCSGDVGLRRR